MYANILPKNLKRPMKQADNHAFTNRTARIAPSHFSFWLNKALAKLSCRSLSAASGRRRPPEWSASERCDSSDDANRWGWGRYRWADADTDSRLMHWLYPHNTSATRQIKGKLFAKKEGAARAGEKISCALVTVKRRSLLPQYYWSLV